MGKNIKELLKEVKAFVLDVDGVLTDGSLILMPDGEQVRTMNIRDGYAISRALKEGFFVCIITGGKSEAVRKRLLYLGVKDVYIGIKDKKDVFDQFLLTHSIQPAHVLYMGDDMPDYEVMKKVGIPTCPKDAVPEIKEFCLYVSDKNGGGGMRARHYRTGAESAGEMELNNNK